MIKKIVAGDNRSTATLYYGRDTRESLRTLPEASIHTVCTSPPYWGLRSYLPEDSDNKALEVGLEESPEAFVAVMMDVFREVKRVLRPDGTLWVNLGDSYAGSGKGCWANKEAVLENQHRVKHSYVPARTETPLAGNVPNGLKPKDLVGIPWRVALALQADGWYLRQDIIWAKRNPMPEPVEDRCTRAHEYLFMFAHPNSKGKYFYDKRAILEPFADSRMGDSGDKIKEGRPERISIGDSFRPLGKPGTAGRNKRSVWTVNPKPYKGSHFAVWPPDLVRPMILAGTSAYGVCAKCGAPWIRISVQATVDAKDVSAGGYPACKDNGSRVVNLSGRGGNVLTTKRLGSDNWQPTCDCVDAQTIPATVLDPFSGSATTGMVALQEGRGYIGLDLNPDYLSLAEARIQDMPAPGLVKMEPLGNILDLFGDHS